MTNTTDSTNTIRINPDAIDYALLLDNAMYGIIKEVLKIASMNKVMEDHYFYISFNTRAHGVLLPRSLLKEYPYEMTIVLQHQFQDLMVHEDYFEVVLTFGGIPERLVVPIKAITSFFDPSVQFGLRFRSEVDFSDLEGEDDIDDVNQNIYSDMLNVNKIDSTSKESRSDTFGAAEKKTDTKFKEQFLTNKEFKDVKDNVTNKKNEKASKDTKDIKNHNIQNKNILNNKSIEDNKVVSIKKYM